MWFIYIAGMGKADEELNWTVKEEGDDEVAGQRKRCAAF